MSIEDISNNLNRIKNNAQNNVKMAVYDCVLDLRGKAQRMAPVDRGVLRGSASSSVSGTGTKITGEVGFGEDYALEQHENLFFNHPKGGQAKYLEKPLMENATNYKQHIADAVRNSIQ